MSRQPVRCNYPKLQSGCFSSRFSVIESLPAILRLGVAIPIPDKLIPVGEFSASEVIVA